MATVSPAIILFAFMLVVAVATASPIGKGKMMDNDLAAKDIRYNIWNEENQAEKSRLDHIMDLWNEKFNTEDDQNKNVYAISEDNDDDDDDDDGDDDDGDDDDDDKNRKEAKGEVDTISLKNKEWFKDLNIY